jgi:hypothetical protein
MIEYKWTISALDCAVNEEGLENVVKTVHWRYRGTDEDGNTAELYGAQPVPSPNPEEFSAYETLTQEVVEGWLESIMDVEEKQKNITDQIELIKHPISVTLPLPSAEVEPKSSDSV